jgi:hypothetical protein
MKIIIDECVPSLVKRELSFFKWNVVSVQDMGWAGVKNGELLRRIAAEFDIFITSDKNLRHQQNLSNLDLAILILPTNQLPEIRAVIKSIDDALAVLLPGDIVEL